MVMCASKKEARAIAGSLLKKKLVACANIIGAVSSEFWWRGKIDKAAETLLLMKTVKSNFRRIESEVKRLHSYEVPEIIALPVIAGSEDYLGWIRKSADA
jgi:periplasmic divalent cation tolerance protein